MFNYANNGITVASILDNRRETAKGTYPVKIRITYNRERKYYSTGKNMTTADWEKLPESKSKTLLAIRADIQNSYDKIKSVIQELEFEGGFSFDALNTRLGKSNSDTLNIAFNAKIQTLLENGQVA